MVWLDVEPLQSARLVPETPRDWCHDHAHSNTHMSVLRPQNADPWIEVDGGITPANAYKASGASKAFLQCDRVQEVTGTGAHTST